MSEMSTSQYPVHGAGLGLRRALANKLMAKTQDKEQLVKNAFWTVLNRMPEPTELEICLESFNEDSNTSISPARVIDLCHTLFMTNEFIYRN